MTVVFNVTTILFYVLFQHTLVNVKNKLQNSLLYSLCSLSLKYTLNFTVTYLLGQSTYLTKQNEIFGHLILMTIEFTITKKKENNKVWHKPKHNHTAKQGCLKRNSANDADDAGENIHKKVLKIKCTKNINKSKNKKKQQQTTTNS